MSLMKQAYPKYLEENSEKLSPEELERYNNQLDIVEELVRIFDSGEENTEKIIDLLNKLQDLGAPPPEVVSQISAGFPNIPGVN